MAKKKDYEFLDDLFDEKVSDKFEEGIQGVKKNFKETIHEKGYDSTADFIYGEFNRAFNDKETKKQHNDEILSHISKEDAKKSRLFYVLYQIRTFKYTDRNRGNYRKGHQAAIMLILPQLEIYRLNIDRVIEIIAKMKTKEGTSRYRDGYHDACKHIIKLIHESKDVLLQEVVLRLSKEKEFEL